ncbi:MAG: DinB family protein [Pyrinomonadaceae bacterium]|nr:DinB family protein [Pyrinomonadaceae bacterium]
MKQELAQLVADAEAIAEDTQKTFGSLSAEQINWKSSADGWSIGQCFEHLIKSNELFYDELDRIVSGTRQNSFLESYSPLSSFFGNLLISSLKKDARKFKAPTQRIVPPSEIDANIVEIFAAHQSELVGKIKLTEPADWRKVKVTSPFMKLITYKLSDGYQVIIEHERRHYRQAERVTQTEGFPQN